MILSLKRCRFLLRVSRGRLLHTSAESSQKSIIHRVVFRARAPSSAAALGFARCFPFPGNVVCALPRFAQYARTLVVTRLDNAIALNRDYRVILYRVHQVREQASYLLSHEIALVVSSEVSNPVTPLSIRYCWPFDAEGTNPQ